MKNRLQKLISILLILVMVMSMATVTTFAETTQPNKDWYNDTDTEFSIGTLAELLGLKELIEKGNDFAGQTVKLSADIDLDGRVCYGTSGKFMGTLDGQGHAIAGTGQIVLFEGGDDIGGKVRNLGIVCGGGGKAAFTECGNAYFAENCYTYSKSVSPTNSVNGKNCYSVVESMLSYFDNKGEWIDCGSDISNLLSKLNAAVVEHGNGEWVSWKASDADSVTAGYPVFSDLVFEYSKDYDVPAGPKGETYTATKAFVATGGAGNYVYSIESDVEGLTINGDNKLVYTRPTVQKETTATIKVKDYAKVIKTITIVIGAVSTGGGSSSGDGAGGSTGGSSGGGKPNVGGTTGGSTAEQQGTVTNPDGTTATTDTTSDGAITTTEKTPDGTETVTEKTPDGTGFSDVADSHWAKDAIDKVVAKGLFKGTTETAFTPNANMTREQMYMVLSRLADNNFASMQEAAAWAKEKGITDGSNPKGDVTREQFVTLMWRTLGSPASSFDLSKYADSSSVSAWAKDAMAWAVETGLVSGTSVTELSPAATATRAQIATIFARYMDK